MTNHTATASATAMTFKKVTAGFYATTDGRYAVMVDGYEYVTIAEREGTGTEAGITGGEWAAVYCPAGTIRESHNSGENIDWYATKREAVNACQAHARRQARRVETPAQAETRERIARFYKVTQTVVRDTGWMQVTATGPDGYGAQWDVAPTGEPMRAA